MKAVSGGRSVTGLGLARRAPSTSVLLPGSAYRVARSGAQVSASALPPEPGFG